MHFKKGLDSKQQQLKTRHDIVQINLQGSVELSSRYVQYFFFARALNIFLSASTFATLVHILVVLLFFCHNWSQTLQHKLCAARCYFRH